MRLPHLVQILKEPSLSFVNHAGLLPLLSLAIVCQIRNIFTFGLAVQLVQFSICVVLYIFWIYVVVYFMSRCCALSRVGLFGGVKTERRARGCWRGENSREEGKEKQNEEWEEVCDGGHGALRSIIRGLVFLSWSCSWPPASKLMNSEAGASAKIEDKLRSGIKYATSTYIKINMIQCIIW